MKKNKISFVINIFIIIFTLIATIMMFTGFKFMHGTEPILEVSKLGMFKFFTVDSNLLMAISSLVYLIELKRSSNDKNIVSEKCSILKLMATTAVSLTFLVVFLYLGPISKDGVISLLQNSNLFFHLLIPLLSIITFVFFEKNTFQFKNIIYGILPTFLYGIFYLINILIHASNGSVSPFYDWYYFVQGGLWQIAIVGPIMFLFSYFISVILWKFNKLLSNL